MKFSIKAEKSPREHVKVNISAGKRMNVIDPKKVEVSVGWSTTAFALQLDNGLTLEVTASNELNYGKIYKLLKKHGIHMRFGANNGSCEQSVADIPEDIRTLEITKRETPSSFDEMRASSDEKGDDSQSSPSSTPQKSVEASKA